MRSISDEFQSELHSGTLKWVTDRSSVLGSGRHPDGDQ